jgi:ABC-2 type transport system permease protein
MTDLLLFWTALRDSMRFRKLVATALLVALPAVIAVCWRLLAKKFVPADVYNSLAGGLIFGFTLIILAVIFATSAVSQELEQRTIVYLLTRPVPRWRILLAKFAASLVVIVGTLWLSSLALALVAAGPLHLRDTRLLRDLAILPVGALAYGGLFLFLATFIRWSLLLGIVFAFGWESWVPSLPGDFSKLSLMAYLRVLAPHPPPPNADTGANVLFGLLNPQAIAPWLAWLILGAVAFASLAGALVVFSDREYVPREDAE